MLQGHPNRDLVHLFLIGITQGFKIGYNYRTATHKPARWNLPGAISHPEVVDEYLQTEVSPLDALPAAHISRFGVIPKGHQPDKWRLIIDLSFPKGQSINDGIPKELCSLQYITIDHTINHIMTIGQGAQLGKIDIKSAFRLLPVHPTDRHLLVMQWRRELFIDTCLPFGLRSAPKLFNILADLLAWVLKQQGVAPLLHYLDNFLTIGPPDVNTCQKYMDTIKEVCEILGVPLAVEKVEGPSTVLSFLGITLDTCKMEARLPEEKLTRIQHTVADWLTRKKATKHEILSLVGQLQHATKVVRYDRTFVARMYSTAAKVPQLDFHTRLNLAFHSDLWWWHTFLHLWNEVSLMHWIPDTSPPHNSIQTDASGSWGCGALFGKLWLQWKWPSEWTTTGIMAKELAPIILCCAVWGPLLSKTKILFQCDNMSVVAAIKKGSAKDDTVMHLLRCLWFFVAYYDIDVAATHIPGVANCTTDHLSGNNMSQFFLLNPQVNQQPTSLPQSLIKIMTTPGMDWTSAAFTEQFNTVISMV